MADTSLQTWNVFNKVSATFAKLIQNSSEIEECDLQVLEQYAVLMYDGSSTTSSVDEARFDLFARKLRSYDLIPPTQNALKEHAKRAAYQAGHIWGQCVIHVIQNFSVLQSGDGQKKMTVGKLSGPRLNRYLRAVRN